MKSKYIYLYNYIMLILKTGRFWIVISFISMLLITGINIFLPEIIKIIIDDGIQKSNIRFITIYCCMYIILILFSRIIDSILKNYFESLKLKVSTSLKLQIIKQLSYSNGMNLSSQKTGKLLHILNNDIFQVEKFGIEMIISIVTNSFTALIVFIILFNFNKLLIIIVCFIQITIFIIQIILSKKITENIKQVRETAGTQTDLLEQFISNLKSVILTNVTGYFLNIFTKKQSDFVNESKKVNRLIISNSNIASTLNSLGTILTYFIGGIMIVQNKMSFGELVAFLQYTALLIAPCMFFISSNINIKQTNLSLEKIYKEIRNVNIVLDMPNCQELKDEIKSIEFKHVTFAYSKDNILNNINITFSSNKITAIVGESGCGKSTLIYLIYGLWKIKNGSLLINSREINEYSISSLRKKICIVTQDVLIFNDDIIENIRLDNKSVNMESIIKICDIVGINNQNGFDKKNLGERGAKLSGGQRQRVAIARALLKQSDVIILDESTSALDNISQEVILRNMEPYLKNKIVIVIAHRLSAIKFADKIIVLKNGEVVETGSHNSLLNKKGIYYTMAKLT